MYRTSLHYRDPTSQPPPLTGHRLHPEPTTVHVNLDSVNSTHTSLRSERFMHKLEPAPVFYPTLEEMEHPIKYIEKITPVGERCGIAKIVPPDGWQPKFALDPKTFRFKTRVQKLNKMEGTTRLNLEYLAKLHRFHQSHLGRPLTKLPQLDRRPIDLFGLAKEVKARGGFEKVNSAKKWAEVGRALHYTRKSTTSLSNGLKNAFVKYVQPYEEWLEHHKLSAMEGEEILRQKEEQGAEEDEDYLMADVKTETDSHENSLTKKRVRIGAEKSVKKQRMMEEGESSEEMKKSTDNGAFGSEYGNSPFNVADLDLPKEARAPKVALPRVYVPEKGAELCEVCGHGHLPTLLLVCDGCDRAFHTYCLEPPLSGSPTSELWYCPRCLTQKPSRDRHRLFEEEGNDYTLGEFQVMADRFKEEWFSTMENPKINPVDHPYKQVLVTEEQVEREFWRLVEAPFETVEVEYGSDIHTAVHGSAFPTVERNPSDPFAKAPFNLTNLSRDPESLLSYVKKDISGMTQPWLYVGMCFSMFCWHTEDHYAYSANYNHWGDTKTWYGLSAMDAAKFEDIMRSTVPELFDENPDLLFQLVTMLNPSRLTERRVSVYGCHQRAGEFVITFPRAYHGGFNQGFNFCEAVNFATSDWAPYGRIAVERYRLYKRAPVFSHDELLLDIYNRDHDNVHVAVWLQSAIVDLVDREIVGRDRIRKYIGLSCTEYVERTYHPREEDSQCIVCRCNAYLTSIKCACNPNRAACKEHYQEYCTCPLSNRYLRLKLSDADLIQLSRTISRVAKIPFIWHDRYSSYMLECIHNGRPPRLATLEDLLQAATPWFNEPHLPAPPLPRHIREAFENLKIFVKKARETVEQIRALARGGEPGALTAAAMELEREAEGLFFECPETVELKRLVGKGGGGGNSIAGNSHHNGHSDGTGAGGARWDQRAGPAAPAVAAPSVR